MTPQELLNWITENNGPALGLCIFILLCLLTILGHFNTFIVGVVRAITGNYPPPTHVECNCNDEDEDETEA